MTGRPLPNEYSAFHSDYVRRAVTEHNVFKALEKQLREMKELIQRIPDGKTSEHLDGKWSVREVLGHLCDTERVHSYRALRIARMDRTPLPGFEQDDYVREACSNDRRVADLLDEFTWVRKSTVATFKHITPEVGRRRGVVNGNEISVRALLYIILGHARRHMEILSERYGV